MSRFIMLVMVIAGCVLVVLISKRPENSAKPPLDSAERKVERPGDFRPVRFSAASSEAAPTESVGTRIANLLNAESTFAGHYLTPIEIAEYLAANRTNALSLVSAFEATRDREYLKQAALAHPNDPLVQAKIISHNVFPERRRELIEQFKKSAPQNSFGNFLSAREKMNGGDVQGALAEIAATEGKRYNDYTREAIIGLDEAYLSAGRPVVEAKALGSSNLLLPQFAPMKKLASEFADLAVEYGKVGDVAAQQSLLEGAWRMGTQLREFGESASLLQDLVGLAMENMALQRWPEGAEAPFLTEKSVAERTAENVAYRKDVRASSSVFGAWLPNAPEHEIIAFYDRLRAFGEGDAMNWLRSRQPHLVQSPVTP
jgi:hypothetical protein